VRVAIRRETLSSVVRTTKIQTFGTQSLDVTRENIIQVSFLPERKTESFAYGKLPYED
jgi:hypothetical protein